MVFDVRTNMLLALVERKRVKALIGAGEVVKTTEPAALGLSEAEDRTVIRLVTSWQTGTEDVQRCANHF